MKRGTSGCVLALAVVALLLGGGYAQSTSSAAATSTTTTRAPSEVAVDFRRPSATSVYEYGYVRKKESFRIAEERCQLYYGGQLASIHSLAEHDFIFSLWNDRRVEVWIGGQRDTAAPSGWSWVDGTPFDFELWMVGEPNNYRANEDCIRMGHTTQGFFGLWNDARCNQRRNYVCKRLAPQPTIQPPFPTSTTTTTSSVNLVPPGFILDNGFVQNPATGCYYLVYTRPRLSWFDARQECKRLGGPSADLASVESIEENAYIDSLFDAIGATDRPRWIGGYRDLATGNFLWADGTPWAFTNWANGEPNNLNNGEDCVSMGFRRFGGEEWNDADCLTRRRFACKVCPPFPGATTTVAATASSQATTTTTTATSTDSQTSTTFESTSTSAVVSTP
ncbi:salivary C-type lectin [Salpingoeca rosetta]|uniref:Salivary C-type lectin n=1 Tax=Salpingoeca rosetta (strain ATCC 50818 / BSB-021) TaxID=946362 RepID=F2UFD4_SALR5|nr:salivary C-type lectin [Salpingoeca rosetta]EGD75334.1 salivary C-type lectin [Salpingoeca rosetta]|eukprot:XP_004992387.1 salivary C-type lectin [Salpingoeca rosetta]